MVLFLNLHHIYNWNFIKLKHVIQLKKKKSILIICLNCAMWFFLFACRLTVLSVSIWEATHAFWVQCVMCFATTVIVPLCLYLMAKKNKHFVQIYKVVFSVSCISNPVVWEYALYILCQLVVIRTYVLNVLKFLVYIVFFNKFPQM